jgi:hypothetical protein
LRRTAEITHTTDPHCGQAPGWPWRRVLKIADSNPSADCVQKGGKAPTTEPVPGAPLSRGRRVREFFWIYGHILDPVHQQRDRHPAWLRIVRR